jgi:hypothetical protein
MNNPMSDADDLNAATKLFTNTLMRSLKGFGLISSFRVIASMKMQSCSSDLRDHWTMFMHELDTNPDYKGILVDVNPNVPRTPNWARIGETFAQEELKNFLLAIDAASLAFAHSILDDAALQYCRVTAIVSPDSWESLVDDKQIKLREVKNHSYDSLLRQKIDDHLDKLERESLKWKIRRLFEICKPDSNFRAIKGFSYDENRLESLDELRHSIIHGPGPVQRLPAGDDDLHFMKLCALYLMMLVNHRFGIRFDEAQLDRQVSAATSEQS